MAHVRLPDPVLLIVAAFSRHLDLLADAANKLEQPFGPVGLASLPYAFTQTSYYEASMGVDLKKQFFVFERLVAADCLADAKLRTNELEQAVADSQVYPEPRPLNLDPGILALGKFMLATTKDQAHRIYLRSGIYAEVTLRFQAGSYEPWTWTYADYRQPQVIAFLNEARDYYRQRLRESHQDGLS
jgi:hypothetical protein